MTIREEHEQAERSVLSERAAFAKGAGIRRVPEEACDIRTCFQRDIDRIVHSKSFRRLKHKTQVFLQPEGDHYRTRMTHTIEVARIARTISRSLRLNEDLTEAIAFGHDLGHTPFGHAGERALAKISSMGFEHNEQSLRVVDILEKDGAGLNLCAEVRDGILCHTGDKQPDTLEGQVVRLSDRIAYINHDVDDAIRAGILEEEDIPGEIIAVTGESYGERIESIIRDVINTSRECGKIEMSSTMYFVMESFRDFMFERVYKNPVAKSEESKVEGMLSMIFDYYIKDPSKLPDDYVSNLDRFSPERVICDYIAGMSDTYLLYTFNNLFVPGAWTVR
ncbi:MAG: deoxyguanosinetriphosphate triphosphohydrolase [Oscillospiraceae bacterium]|nr:deoxyguanosinetriphosphate triphosphohydrolase [Oscillospiraceae bacterium]